jgi:asparagine N-glycosylation enzyme membrane subunit Stt3
MQRPKCLLVLGILNILFGVLAITSVPMTLKILLTGTRSLGLTNPIVKMFQENAAYAAFTKVFLSAGLVVAVVLLVAGLGLLLARPWGRVLSIGYGLYGTIATIIHMAANLWFFLPVAERASHMPMGPERMRLIFSLVTLTIGTCLGLIYPAILLVLMCRDDVRAALTSADQTPCE